MSAFGGKADMANWLGMSAFDPKRTSAAQNCCCATWSLNPISSVANPCC